MVVFTLLATIAWGTKPVMDSSIPGYLAYDNVCADSSGVELPFFNCTANDSTLCPQKNGRIIDPDDLYNPKYYFRRRNPDGRMRVDFCRQQCDDFNTKSGSWANYDPRTGGPMIGQCSGFVWRNPTGFRRRGGPNAHRCMLITGHTLAATGLAGDSKDIPGNNPPADDPDNQDYAWCYVKQGLTATSGAPASSAGDPHILRFDGTAFDIDTAGSYSLFDVAGGGQFSVKSKVAHDNLLNSELMFNMECEFGGSWLDGRNVTAVAAGAEAGMEAGIYFDGLFLSIPKLLQNTSQYTWEFTGHSKMILEICQIASDMSDYCISALRLRRKSGGRHAFLTMVTDVANVTVRYNSIHFAGHLDIYTTLQQNADSTQIGGLLAGGRQGTRRKGDSFLLASSVGAVGDVGIEG